MPGSVISVLAEHGSTLEVGEPVLIIEAMKMEHVLRAPFGGIVELRVVAGEQVGSRPGSSPRRSKRTRNDRETC